MSGPIAARAAGRRLAAVLGAIAFVPLAWTSPGRVSADTKSYLTLDPGRLLARAVSMWDPGIGFGTVTHQTIGYLFPLGPYYWLLHTLGVPAWISQRLWLGLLFFAAGTGVASLLRHLGWAWPAVSVAAIAYQLSPYVLDYAARISVILLPWAALGWLVVFTVRATREGGWRWPAAMALTVATVGGVNATALVLAGLAPVLWVICAVATRDVTVRRALAAVARIALLCGAISSWWIAGLAVQGRYGIPILRYTETYEAVARTSTAPEILRGLGYWFFYGRDKVSPWVGPAEPYTQRIWLVLVSYAVPTIALGALAAVRARHRAYALALLVVGLTVAVGSHPYRHPAPYGWLFARLSTTTIGSALRSTPRVVPLVALAVAMGLGSLAAAAGERVPRRAWPLAGAVVALVAAAMPAWWTGRILTPSILRPETVPAYWRQAASAIDAGGASTRVLESPGSDFADYRWGGTVDPITPGITDRPYVARELVPYGSAPSADLLNAYERRIADRVAEPAALAPLLRMMSVGSLVVRNDLQYERYRVARPRSMRALLADAPGFGAATSFGSAVPNRPISRLPLVDAEELTTPASVADPSPVEIRPVANARPIVSTVLAGSPTVVSGDGEGLVDLAAAGLLDDSSPVLSTADLVARPDAAGAALGATPHLVLTDSNRRQARRWGSVRENLGYTEVAGEVPLRRDPTDNRLDVFPGAGDDSRTVAVQDGVGSVQATGYGNPITYTPEDRAAMALDGDPRTAWRVGAFADVTGERLEIVPSKPVTTDHVVLLQPINGARNRWITAVRITVNGSAHVDVELDDSSRTEPGQTISLASALGSAPAITSLSIEIVRTNFTKLPGYRGISAVGFAEVGLGPVHVHEVLRLPNDLFVTAPDAAAGGRVTIEVARDRASPLEPNRTDPELALARRFELPAPRSFTISGTVRAAPRADDRSLSGVLDAGGTVAVASDRLDGGPVTRGQLAIDGDPQTAWQTPIDSPLQTLTVTAPAPVAVDHLDLGVRADGRHSVPTTLSIAVDGGEPVVVAVPPIADRAERDAVVTVRIDLPSLRGRSFTVAITAVRAVTSIDYFSELAVVQPVAIAELGAAPLAGGALGGSLDPACRSDLLTIDGAAVAVRLVGDRRTMASGAAVGLVGCQRLDLAPGPHQIETAVGRDLGIDVDRLVLDSPAPPGGGGGSGANGPPGNDAATSISSPLPAQPAPGDPSQAAGDPDQQPASAPAVTVRSQSPTAIDLEIAPSDAPYWLVLGESRNAGWHAIVSGHDLGPSTLVNGYANGWLLTSAGQAGALTVHLEWTPQRMVRTALWVSLVAAVLCVALVIASSIRVGRRARLATSRPAGAGSGSGSGEGAGEGEGSSEGTGGGPMARLLDAAARALDHVAGEPGAGAPDDPGTHAAAVPGIHRLGLPAVPPDLAPAPPVDDLPAAAAEPRSAPRIGTVGWRRAAITATVGGLLAFAVAGPWVVGAVVLAALAVVAVARLPAGWRWLLALGPVGFMVLAVGYTVAKQVRYDLPTDLEWPRAFEPSHVLAWCAVATTVVTAALIAAPPSRPARRRSARQATPERSREMAQDGEDVPQGGRRPDGVRA